MAQCWIMGLMALPWAFQQGSFCCIGDSKSWPLQFFGCWVLPLLNLFHTSGMKGMKGPAQGIRRAWTSYKDVPSLPAVSSLPPQAQELRSAEQWLHLLGLFPWQH